MESDWTIPTKSQGLYDRYIEISGLYVFDMNYFDYHNHLLMFGAVQFCICINDSSSLC